ncbi:MAG: hypothetical protein OXT65_12535 [Alphaproteobacteria bacterium]|nr:hypothetical protein [Alphaproteobacteria bacterium]
MNDKRKEPLHKKFMRKSRNAWQNIKNAFNRVAGKLRPKRPQFRFSSKTARAVFVETLRDLHKPSEVAKLIVAVIVPIPGFSLTYVAYRMHKHHQYQQQKGMVANDNAVNPSAEKLAHQPKQAKKNAGPKPA